MTSQGNPQPVQEVDLTIDALAERVGMTVRNLREWKTLGLLPPAEMRGRVGFYAPTVVDRVERIKKLHAEGFTLELIARMLDAGGDAADEVMHLAGTLRTPFPETGGARGSEYSARRIAEIADQLDELGIAPEQMLDATAEIRSHTGAIAEIFERVWMESVWEPFVAAGAPEEEMPRIQETAARVKPLALDAVVALFTVAMEAQIEQGIARELARASETRSVSPARSRD